MRDAACVTDINQNRVDELDGALQSLAEDLNEVRLRDVEALLFKISDFIVDAVVAQRLEVLSREAARLNLVANTSRYLCQDYPDNSELFIALGRIEQLLDIIDLADDTALPSSTINAIVENATYLQILQSVSISPEVAASFTQMEEMRPALDWLSQNRLIRITPAAITFGRKGQSAFREALEDIGIQQGTRTS